MVDCSATQNDSGTSVDAVVVGDVIVDAVFVGDVIVDDVFADSLITSRVGSSER